MGRDSWYVPKSSIPILRTPPDDGDCCSNCGDIHSIYGLHDFLDGLKTRVGSSYDQFSHCLRHGAYPDFSSTRFQHPIHGVYPDDCYDCTRIDDFGNGSLHQEESLARVPDC